MLFATIRPTDVAEDLAAKLNAEAAHDPEEERWRYEVQEVTPGRARIVVYDEDGHQLGMA